MMGWLQTFFVDFKQCNVLIITKLRRISSFLHFEGNIRLKKDGLWTPLTFTDCLFVCLIPWCIIPEETAQWRWWWGIFIVQFLSFHCSSVGRNRGDRGWLQHFFQLLIDYLDFMCKLDSPTLISCHLEENHYITV